MILNNNNKNKSSTEFFMKDNNKDDGVPCFDGLYNVPRKEENKENSEIKVKVKGGSLVMWKFQDKKGEFSLSQIYMWVYTTTHFISLLISHGKWWK